MRCLHMCNNLFVNILFHVFRSCNIDESGKCFDILSDIRFSCLEFPLEINHFAFVCSVLVPLAGDKSDKGLLAADVLLRGKLELFLSVP